LLKGVEKAGKSKEEIHEIFDDFDDKSSGWIKIKDFEKVLSSRLKCKLKDSQISLLTKKLDPDRERSVNYEIFEAWLDSGRSLSNVEKKLRAFFYSMEKKDFLPKYVFKKMDPKDRGSVKRKDFKDTLEGFGVGMSGQEIRAFMDKYDEDKSGKIELEEIKKVLKKKKGGESNDEDSDGGEGKKKEKEKEKERGRSKGRRSRSRSKSKSRSRSKSNSRSRSRSVDESDEEMTLVASEVRSKLKSLGKRTKSTGGLQKLFEEFDENEDGVIDKKELKKILKKQRIALSSEQIADLIDCVDLDQNGSIR